MSNEPFLSSFITKKFSARYKKYSPSGGLMLETFSSNVTNPGRPHYKAKTKIITDRIKTIENAEEIKYPITTGLLLGITETKQELIDDIEQLILFSIPIVNACLAFRYLNLFSV